MAYTTLALLRKELGVEGTDDDDLLADMIEDAQNWIDAHCDRTFEASSDTTLTYDANADTDGYVLNLREDLCAITTVKTDADGDNTTVSSTEYITLPRDETPYYGIKILASSEKAWEYTNDPEMGITVLGRWAYSTAAPKAVRRACTRLAAYYYKLKDADTFDVQAIPDAGVITVPQGVPRDVLLKLEPYRRK